MTDESDSEYPVFSASSIIFFTSLRPLKFNPKDFVNDLAFMILEFVYILIVQLVMRFIQLISIIASNIMVSVPVIIFIVYTMHQLTYDQIGIITNPNLDFDPFISSIIMIYFQKMRNKYYINIINNHIELINNIKPDKKTQPD